MSNFRLNLPVDVPWRLLDASADMMDARFCDKKLPPAFQSSLAIYGYEPVVDDLSPELCGQTLTYLKVSCSITGYQPSPEEIDKAIVDLKLSDRSESDLNKMTPYFGCYGVLVNVSVFPFDAAEAEFDNYPHIVDFEPKVRDFYQIASETGEILSGSVHRVSVGKSFMFADSTEDSWSMSETDSQDDGQGNKTSTTGSVSNKRTETDQANFSVQSDFSRERRELHATTTHLSQMYNLLSSYHAGTNRATFLMLPRPHILQPTNRRTFVDGLRVIEGMQDFFLVVARRKEDAGLRVEVNLQTGHFPEDVPDVPVTGTGEAPPHVDRDITLEFPTVGGGGGTRETVRSSRRDIGSSEGLEIDDSAFNKGAEFIERELVDGIGDGDIKDHGWGASREVATESGVLRNVLWAHYRVEKGWLASEGTIRSTYRVRLRPVSAEVPATKADRHHLLITQRALCTTIKSEGRCLTRVPPRGLYEPLPGLTISDEIEVSFQGVRYGAMVEKLKNAFIGSHRRGGKYKTGTVGYLQTGYFQSRVKTLLPPEQLQRELRHAGGVAAELAGRLEDGMTVEALLNADPGVLARRLGMDQSEVARLRSRVLGIADAAEQAPTTDDPRRA